MVTKEKKYEFYASTRHNGVTLHSIRALKDMPSVNVMKGDIGGWIESESNLDQYDDSWVYKDARVSGKARVINNSYVYGVAKVYGNAVINNSSVHGAAVVYGNAVINNSEVGDAVEVKDNAVITDSTLRDHVVVYSDAVVTNCDIDCSIRIHSNTDTSRFKKLSINFRPEVHTQYTLSDDEKDLVEYIVKTMYIKPDSKFDPFDTKTYHITPKHQDDTKFIMEMSRFYSYGNGETNTLTEIYMLKLMINNLEDLEEVGLSKCSSMLCKSIVISIERTTYFNICAISYKMKAPLLDADKASDDEYMDNFRKVLNAYSEVFEYNERRKK